MPHIFISHSSQDDDAITRLHDALERDTGREVWIDHVDIAPGADFDRSIQAALNACDTGIIALSPDAVASRMCRAEWLTFQQLGVPFLVVLLAEIPPADFPWWLRAIQYVDLRTDWDAGLRQIAAALRGEAPAPGAAGLVRRRITGTIDRRLTQIPISGRDTDLERITARLREGAVVIAGMGGIGKSRLAAEIARAGADFDGALWQRCTPHTLPDEVIALAARHFRLDPATPRHAILDKLRGARILAVIDNAEDLPESRHADFAALIHDLLDTGTRALLTSRAEWDARHLVAPYRPHTVDLAAARQIVIDMGAAYSVPHDLHPHADAIARAGRQHPRLIEWAVMKMARRGVPAVLRELEALESRDAQGALDEMVHKTLRQAVAAHQETHDDGDALETALRRLCVFQGGFTRAAARAVLALSDHEDALIANWHNVSNFMEDLQPLVDRYAADDALDAALDTLQTWQFVHMQPQPGGDARYTVDSIAQVALPVDEAARRPHHAYYRALAWLHDARQDYAGLDVESENLAAAFDWALASGDGESALWLANAATYMFWNRGRFRLAVAWSQQVAAALESHPDRQLWANAQNTLGNAYRDLAAIEDREDNLQRAVAAYEQALRFRTPEAAPLDYAMTQNNLGNAYWNLSDIEDRAGNLWRAVAAYEEALRFHTPEAAPLSYAMTQNNLGNAYGDLAAIEDADAGNRRENLRRAVAAYEEALRFHTPEAAPLHYARTQNNLGIAYYHLSQSEDADAGNRRDNLQRAIDAYTEALRFLTPQAAPLSYAGTQANLGLVHEKLGDLPAAVACWREAERYFRQMGAVDRADLMLRWIADAEDDGGAA